MGPTLCFVALVIAGCSSKPPSSSETRPVESRPVEPPPVEPRPVEPPPKPTTDPAPQNPPVVPPASGTKPGDDCSKGQACTAPATCVSYLGIAGARGPTFKSCEIKCTGKTACPAGTSCVTIADGPGQVCR